MRLLSTDARVIARPMTYKWIPFLDLLSISDAKMACLWSITMRD